MKIFINTKILLSDPLKAVSTICSQIQDKLENSNFLIEFDGDSDFKTLNGEISDGLSLGLKIF